MSETQTAAPAAPPATSQDSGAATALRMLGHTPPAGTATPATAATTPTTDNNSKPATDAGQGDSSDATRGTSVPPADNPWETELSTRFNNRFKTTADLEKFLKEHDELTANYTKLKDTNPFANNIVKELNDFMARGGEYDTFSRGMSLNPDTLTPEQKVSIHKQLTTNGLSPEDADFMVQQEFKLGADFDANANDVRYARLKFNEAANIADAYLRDHKAKLMVPDQQRIAQERVNTLSPLVPKVMEGLKKVSFDLGDKTNFDYEVPQETLNEVAATINGQLSSIDTSNSKNPAELINHIAHMALVTKELPNILAKQKANLLLEFAKEKHHPRIPGSAPATDGDGKTLSGAEWANKMLGN